MKLSQLALLLLSFLFTSQVFGAKSKIILCGNDAFEPYTFKDEKTQKEIYGPQVDFLKRIANDLGYELVVNYYPFKRMLIELEQGDLDCAFTLFRNDEREAFANFTDVPIHVSKLSIFTHKDKSFKFRGLEDLFGKRIAIVRGFSTTKQFDEAKQAKKIKVKEFTGPEQIFSMLNSKRIDGTIMNSTVAKNYIKKNKLLNIIELPISLANRGAYIAFSKKGHYPFLASPFTGFLFKYLLTGKIGTIYRKAGLLK